MAKLYSIIVEKYGDPFTQSNVEEFVVENIHFGDEALSKINPKYLDHTMPDQDYAPKTISIQ